MESHNDVMNRALSRIEAYLLPSAASKNENPGITPLSIDLTPRDRLDHILYQVTLADHLRVMQTMYRDSHDDQSLMAELRAEGPNTKLPIKHLMQKIVEGRSRAIGLIKMMYGEDHLAYLKGQLDLTSSYALQGMWPQVEDKISLMNEKMGKMSRIVGNRAALARRKNALIAAERISCVFSCLRDHVIRNCGHVFKSFIKEVMSALVALLSHEDDEADPLGHPSKFAAAFHTYFMTRKGGNLLHLKREYGESYFSDDLNHLTAEHRAVRDEQERLKQQQEVQNSSKSWGEVLDYFRYDCEIVKLWVEAMNIFILPQHRAAMLLPFKVCDMQQRNIAHPMQLSQLLSSYPSSARLLMGSDLVKILSQIRIEVPLSIDMRSGSLTNLHQEPIVDAQGKQQPPPQKVFYELPISVEEYLALYLLETSNATMAAEDGQLELLKVQLLTIRGVCSIYTDKLETAEEQLRLALNGLEALGLEMEIVACELYNSIAQMMIMQHRRWISGRKQRLKEEAALWLETEEGRQEVRSQLKSIKKQFNYKSAPIAAGEMEQRAKNAALRKRVTALTNKEIKRKKIVKQGQKSDAVTDNAAADMNKSLEAAYRYLVRSFEILESTHGSMHPSVGTACLAVASVQNILEDYEDTRDWLMRALRYMEKFNPLPQRAISFTQIQLSQVLSKLGHEDEARMVLSKAAGFHMSRANQMLLDHNNPEISTSYHHGPSKIGSHPDPAAAIAAAAAAAADEANILDPPDSARPETARSNATANSRASARRGGPGGGSVAGIATGGGGGGGGGRLNYGLASPPIMKNSPLYEEINTALDVMSKVMRMSTHAGDKWQAALQAEDIARLTESAFGWDSAETAEACKQVT